MRPISIPRLPRLSDIAITLMAHLLESEKPPRSEPDRAGASFEGL
jgi:hypothetical protein